MKHLSIAVLCLWLSQGAWAAHHFPTSPQLEIKTEFWEKIFTRYKSSQIVVHDRNDLRLILGTIEMPRLALESNLAADLEMQTARYEDALNDFAVRGPRARRLTPLHAQIWKVYSKSRQGLPRLLAGQVELRTQGGLSDTFKNAYQTSQLYLPRMERIFRDHQLPHELTRIVFVESMFNLKARSKVGASGIWQLMPSAARPFMRVNSAVDERNSPLIATQAAARILKSNYAALGNWPLAITAYNHGLGGMRRAVEQTGSRSLETIVSSYDSGSFGFASQNFYAEFLAALRTHQRFDRVVQAKKNPNRRPPRLKVASESSGSR